MPAAHHLPAQLICSWAHCASYCSLQLTALLATLHAVQLIIMATDVDSPLAVRGFSHAYLAAKRQTRGQENVHSVGISMCLLCSCSVNCKGVCELTSPGRLSRSIRQEHGRLQKPTGSPCTTCSRLSARQAMRGSIISSNAGASTSTPCKMLHKL